MATNNLEIFKAVLEQLPEGVVVVDDSDEIIFVNRAAEEIRRISATQITGRNVVLCHPEKSHERVGRALQFLRRQETRAFTRMVIDKEQGRYYENTYAPVRDAASNYIGSVVVSRDITDKRRLEEERALHLQNLEEKVAELSGKLQDLFIASMASLVKALEAKDRYTQGHSLRVSDIAVKMAEHIWGVSPEANEVGLAGKLHDIGKVGIREMILNKPARLADEEFEHIKAHPLIGERILAPIEKLKPVAKVIAHHHERYDGKGYPASLGGEGIPVGSRILALADSYDAMTSARPYRPPKSAEEAAKEIRNNLGRQFDPRWGEIFLELFYSGSIG
ncbi:MAG: HD domain-containing protein [Chloroflexi bacterium]|nr:HD domain-containing protein [Chloroflexota bacterium]